MAAPKVSLYVRERGSRNITPANPKKTYPLGTIFLIRYRRDGKRAWETLTNCPTINDARVAVMKLQTALLIGSSSKELAQWQKHYRQGKPIPASIPEEAKPGDLMRKAAIERYLENASLKSAKTSTSYTHTMNQFSASCGDKPLTQITKQDLINFVPRVVRISTS